MYLQDRTDRLLELLREGIRRADRKGRLGPRKIYEEETGEYEENE